MLTILLADDEHMIVALCSQVLAGIRNVSILQAQSGRDALDLATRHDGAIDLLLSDIRMPGELNGFQLAERLEAARPAIKVLLMSGYTCEAFQLRPTWHFLPKPFPPATLLAKVEEALGCALPVRVAPQRETQMENRSKRVFL